MGAVPLPKGSYMVTHKTSTRTHPVSVLWGTESPHRTAGTEGDTMTPLTALLCLGLSVGAMNPVQAGTLPRPTLWAEPGPVIPWGQPVTLWCQGAPGTQEFYMDKEGNSWNLSMPMALKPGDKAKFSIEFPISQDAGIYRCYYRSPTGWSKLSDPLELVVTEPSGDPDLQPFVPTDRAVSDSDHTVENLIRLALSGFILLLLGVLVLEAWYSQRGVRSGLKSSEVMPHPSF